MTTAQQEQLAVVRGCRNAYVNKLLPILEQCLSRKPGERPALRELGDRMHRYYEEVKQLFRPLAPFISQDDWTPKPRPRKRKRA